MTGKQYAILQVLAEQSEGYLCGSTASAFIATGLEEIDEDLIALQDDKLVEFFTEVEEVTVIKVKRDEEGKPVYVEDTVEPLLNEDGEVQTEVISIPADEGWVITEKGRKELNG